MCTALTYKDASARAYVGRTLELQLLLPYFISYVPAGTEMTSQVPGKDPLTWTAKHGFVSVGVPTDTPKPGAPVDPSSLLLADGINDAGLVFNANAFAPASETPDEGGSGAVLQALSLGIWLLSSFGTIAEARTGIANQPINANKTPIAGNVPWPLHIMLTDATGAAIVIEAKDGMFYVHDNPVNVMTNYPPFDWHLQNLNNWTHLTNVDQSTATFGSLNVSQPDSGIATAALPASNASVGRFVKAVYYTTFTEKVDDPDKAVQTLSAIINNFDRPRGVTKDAPGAGGEGVSFGGTTASAPAWTTEYTTWTSMADTARRHYYLRPYAGINWSRIDLTRLTGLTSARHFGIEDLDPFGGDATELLLNAKG